MRQSVVDRLVSLQAQLGEAKGHYEDEMDAYEVNPSPVPVPIPNANPIPNPIPDPNPNPNPKPNPKPET